MKVAIWAEIRRLAEVEKLSQRAIARRLKCCQRTVAKALRMQHPPDGQRRLPRSSRLDPWKAKIDDLLSRFPDLSASRIHEEIRRSPDGYQGGVTLVREYVRRIRRRPSRVYQTVQYEPGQAMQGDPAAAFGLAARSATSPFWSQCCAIAACATSSSACLNERPSSIGQLQTR